MSEAKSVTSPMAYDVELSSLSLTLQNPSLYRSMVGVLQYVILSHPDVAFAVNRVCQYMHSPTKTHWFTVKCILRYLKGILRYGLWFHHDSPRDLEAFNDADWASSRSNHRLTSGYAIYLDKNLIS